MKVLSFILFFVFASIVLFWAPSCANIIPPAGGPRDSIPPVLLKATPADSTLNFTGKQIEFQFDEYVDLQDIQNNLLFTPTFERNPEIAVKGKDITVRFREGLEPNTTYILNFGNAIRDVNEMNVYKGFRYTFSTGPVLDSLELSGKVILAQNGKVDSTMIVVLHRDLQDSAVYNKRPLYITRVDNAGNFRFQNLPEGTFAIYAIGDAGLSRRYQRGSQLFAFLDSAVTVGKQDSALTLYAYRDAPVTPPVTITQRGAGPQNRDRLAFSTTLSNNQQDLLKDLQLFFPSSLRMFDSGRIQLSIDSMMTPVPHTKTLDSAKRILTIKTSWIQDRQYNLYLDRDFAEDSLGKKLLKTDTLNFRTKKESDYAAINIKIRNADESLNPVLLFVQNEQVVYAAPLVNGSVVVQRFIPGEYELRLLYDRNKNLTWDPGKFYGGKRQPELVRPIDRRINVKTTSENEIEIVL